MGISLNKIHADQDSMFCPTAIENLREAGSVYLVIHESKTAEKDSSMEKLGKSSHFCMAVDITDILR
jgi:hypothetical protein